MLNLDAEVLWADSCKKSETRGEFLNAEIHQKIQNRKSMIFKNKLMFLHHRGWNGVCGAVLAAFHTNFLCLIRSQRSCGRIPGGNRKQIGICLEAGVDRYGVDKRSEKNKNGIQWSPGALVRSEMTRALARVGF